MTIARIVKFIKENPNVSSSAVLEFIQAPTVTLNKNGTFYKVGGKFHREHGPAIEHANGNKEWYKHGKLHREDGPAIEWHNGSKEWYINGKLHREDGPAREWSDGTKAWYKCGLLHQEDGPAIIYGDSGEAYMYINGAFKGVYK